MKHDVKQLHFFDWFYNTITYPTIIAICKIYTMFYEDDYNEENMIIVMINVSYGGTVTYLIYTIQLAQQG